MIIVKLEIFVESENQPSERALWVALGMAAKSLKESMGLTREQFKGGTLSWRPQEKERR